MKQGAKVIQSARQTAPIGEGWGGCLNKEGGGLNKGGGGVVLLP